MDKMAGMSWTDGRDRGRDADRIDDRFLAQPPMLRLQRIGMRSSEQSIFPAINRIAYRFLARPPLLRQAAPLVLKWAAGS